MRPKLKIAAATGIVALGVTIALPFRPAEPVADGTPSFPRFRSDDSRAASPPPAIEEDANRALLSGGIQTTDGTLRAEPVSRSRPADRDDAASAPIAGDPPELPAAYALAPLVPRPQKGTRANFVGEIDERDEGPTVHRVAEGDTLSRLAQRYLGHPDRAEEIFAANRDVLREPDLLPIGARLVIPPRTPPAVAAGSVALPAATPRLREVSTGSLSSGALSTGSPSTGSPSTGSPSTGSPVAPPAAPGAAAQPAAVAPVSGALVPITPRQLAQAYEAAQRPNVHRVQEGETLPDIARKIYGDANRAALLFETNRQLLRTPEDVRPGMLLTLP